MCSTIFKNDPKIAYKDITVYKIYSVDFKEDRILLESPHQLEQIKSRSLNELDVLDKSTQQNITKYDIGYEGSSYYELNIGFHAYKEYKWALSRIQYSEVIIKCIIPKGSIYYENDHEICSSTLIVDTIPSKKNVLIYYGSEYLYENVFKRYKCPFKET